MVPRHPTSHRLGSIPHQQCFDQIGFPSALPGEVRISFLKRGMVLGNPVFDLDVKLGRLASIPVILTGMAGHQQCAVVLSQVFKRSVFHLQAVFTPSTNERKIYHASLADDEAHASS